MTPDGMAPPWLHAAPVEPYPFADTDDPDSGPAPHPVLGGLLAYVGRWRGRGRGGYPTIEDFDYAQEIRISHDGRPFLSYESRAWLLDEQSRPVRPAGRESGWLRPVLPDSGSRADSGLGADSDPGADSGAGADPAGLEREVEALICTPTGIMELHYGRVDAAKLELATDAVVRTATAKEVSAGRRLFGIVDGALLYVQELAAVGHPLTPHLSARLTRV